MVSEITVSDWYHKLKVKTAYDIEDSQRVMLSMKDTIDSMHDTIDTMNDTIVSYTPTKLGLVGRQIEKYSGAAKCPSDREPTQKKHQK